MGTTAPLTMGSLVRRRGARGEPWGVNPEPVGAPWPLGHGTGRHQVCLEPGERPVPPPREQALEPVLKERSMA